MNEVRKLSLILGYAALALGLCVIVGWKVNISFLIQIFPDSAPMQFNTALLLVASAASLVFFVHRLGIFGRVLSFFVFVFSFLTFIQYVFGLNFHMDQLFHEAQITTKSISAGRMAPNTAISYMVIGLAGFLYRVGSVKSKNWIPSCLAAIAVAFGFVSILGYFTNFQEAYGWYKLSDMALHTGLGFILLGSGFILATITFNRKGKISSWILAPMKMFSYIVILIIWRAIEQERMRSIYLEQVYHPNFLVYFSLMFFVIFVLYLQSVSIKLTDELEETSYNLDITSESKTNILNYVGHEIRNPLSAVIGFSEPFINRIELSKEVQESFASIYAAGTHMNSIIEDLLAVSRFNSGKIQVDSQEYQFNTWVDKIFFILNNRAKKLGVELSYHYPDTMPDSLRGDSLKLAQILMNLVENAFKYTNKGEKIDVYFWLESKQGSPPLLYIKVKDTGKGIPKEKRENLFTPFFQAHSGDTSLGLGLGLSICKEYLELMGGRIYLEESEEKGSSFVCEVEAYL